MTVDFCVLQGKCSVVYGDNIQDLSEYFGQAPDRFYFTEAYDAETKMFEEPPNSAQQIGNTGKGKVYTM